MGVIILSDQIMKDQERFDILDCVNTAPSDECGYYRIFTITTRTVKYLRYSCAKSPVPDIRGTRLGFTALPIGRWNCAEITVDPTTHKYAVTSLSTIAMQSILAWHPVFVDSASLGRPTSGLYEGELQCHNKIQSAIFPRPTGLKQISHRRQQEQQQQQQSTTSYQSLLPQSSDSSIFVHYTWWPSDVRGPAHESHIHSLVHSRSAAVGVSLNVVPRFLAHLTENNSRIIGYVTEHIKGRPAEPADLEACQVALAKLHATGIAYGPSNAEEFLVPDDPTRGVVLHSFGTSFETSDARIFKAEIDSVKDILENDARRRRRAGKGTRI